MSHSSEGGGGLFCEHAFGITVDPKGPSSGQRFWFGLEPPTLGGANFPDRRPIFPTEGQK